VCRRRWFRVQAYVPSLGIPDPAAGLISSPQNLSGDFIRDLPESIADVLQDTLLSELFGEFLQRVCVGDLSALRFCLDAERCISHLSRADGAVMLNELIGVYLMPGRKDCIWKIVEVAPSQQDLEDEVGKGGDIGALFRTVQRFLEEKYLPSFVQSPECALYMKGLRQDYVRNSDIVRPLVGPMYDQPTAAPDAVYNFQLIKVNERGKRQERTLRISRAGYQNVRGDTERLTYDARDVHGIHVSNEDPLSFEVAVLHRYQYECTSNGQRFQIAQAFEALGLGQTASEDLLDTRAQILKDGAAIFRDAKGSPMSQKDFDILVRVGKGGMGKILKVRHRASNQIYAMKVQKVASLIENDQLERAKTEMQILTTLDHPFLVQLHFCFEDQNQICMCLDFCAGGDLFHHLKRIKGRRLHYKDAGFYIAEIILALEYLHSREIVHRDLKPENILLCVDGHLKITDFGLSKTSVSSIAGSDDDHGTRATSLVGTKEYVSPEIIQHQPYGQAVDWWAVGVLFYELLTGRPPFDSRENDLFNRIVNNPVKFPEAIPIQDSAKNLIVWLLQKRPELRPTVDQTKAHDFFTSSVRFNWEQLKKRAYEPPVKPEVTLENFPTKHTAAPLESFVQQSPALPEEDVAYFNFKANPK